MRNSWKRVPAWFAGTVLVIGTTHARADETTSLTVAQAIQMAQDHAPNVMSSRFAMREANARLVGAGLWMPSNPRVTVEARPPVTGGTPNDLGYGATLEVPLGLSGAPSARVREAERGIDVARSEFNVEQATAKAAAWTAYVKARIAQQRISEVEQASKNAERVLAATSQRLDAGAVGEADQTLATTEVAEAQVALSQARATYDSELMALRGTLDFAADRALQLVSAVHEPTAAPEQALLIQLASQKRPELRVIEQRLRHLNATGERLAKEVFPLISVYGGVDAAPVSPIFGFVGVSVELPVAQRNQGPRAQVAAARDSEVHRGEREATRIIREVVLARKTYESRREELRILTTAALPAANRTLELLEIGWRSGRFDLFRVTTALREVARIRNLRLDAMLAAWVALITLDRTVGGLTP